MGREVKMDIYNNRYVAYAASRGCTPQDQLVDDDQKWPGGKMAGFMIWISKAWQEWAEETGECKKYGDEWSDQQHGNFDDWLTLKYVCNCWSERDGWGHHKHEFDCAAEINSPKKATQP